MVFFEKKLNEIAQNTCRDDKRLYFCRKNKNHFLIIKKTSSIMKDLVAKINEQIAAFSENAALQVEKGNKAAGVRARKASLELEKSLKEFRKVSIAASK
ncbi:MAG TPA: histone H1-like protein [Bacteroidales bacterium]|nr:histone H1-like protein [Bacteroidales bacterium]